MSSPDRTRSRSSSDESGVDVRRYMGILRRSRGLIIAIVALFTGVVLVLSLLLPKSYEATAKISLSTDTGLFGSSDAESIQRRLATIQALVGSPSVEQAASDKLGDATDGEIGNATTATVDPAANLVSVTGADGDPKRAADIANAVANSFLDVQSELERERLSAAEVSLTQQLQGLSTDPTAAAETSAIRQQLSALSVQRASAGSELQLAESAEVPSSPASPRPFRNALLAFFAALFLGVLIALGRDQLRPGISEPRELSRLTGIPILTTIPYSSQRTGRNRSFATAIENEAYQTLSAAIQLSLPPSGRQHVILVTSAVHAEGKTTVSSRLGRALVQSGHKTLIVSADMRWPSLHEAFGLPLRPGLSEALNLAGRAGVSDYMLPATAHAVNLPSIGGREPAELHVLTSGGNTSDPGGLLASDGAREFFRHIRSFDYSYVLVDSPPVLGIADTPPLIQLTDRVLIVARLDRLTVDTVIDMQEVTGRFGAKSVGLVVVGSRVDVSPYYLDERPSIMRSTENAGNGSYEQRT